MSIELRHPLPGSTPTDGFGWRGEIKTPNGTVPAQLHNGQDFAAASGTPILAAHAGTVTWSGWDVIGGGWGVMLTHKDGWQTLYFHMRERSTDVRIGQTVKAGQTIGRVGASGLATGAHLHFMLRVNGVDVDPMPHISGTSKPSTTNPTTIEEIGEDEMRLWIADIKGGWYLIVPGGSGKPNAVSLPGDSGMAGGGAAKAGIPVIRLSSIDSLRRVANV